MEPAKVFISSTWIDLVPERNAVEKALHRLKAARFVGMEYFGTRDDSTRTMSLKEVEGSAVYVGVIGHRHGSGITEAEYREARRLALPCLIYLKDGEPDGTHGAEDAHRLSQLRSELRARHTVCLFKTPEELAMRLVADVHNLLFERLVMHGVDLLRSDYEARVRNFLAEYLGDPTDPASRPIAFGGREREIEHLHQWMRRDPAQPYALLAGPAGRGKSALLVHWARQISREPDVAVVFFPVSVRFRTNLASVAFATLCARLAALHEEPVPGGVDTPPEVWRALLLSYLSRNLPNGQRLLLILDGVDETADWQLDTHFFPARPPPHLRVLVAARYLAGDVDSAGWLERLGWTRPGFAQAVDLRPLNPEGLVQVLKGMSVPLEALSARSEIVAELFRLTQGDPLLVHLYAADLWSQGEQVARLKPSDLATLEPGLDGYFRRWWEDQRSLWGTQMPTLEPAVSEVLNTLSCALGPLACAELIDLMPDERKPSVWALEAAMHALRRFVIGDGQSHGYAFSHPRLADYFYEQLARAKQAQRQEARFVAWGLRCIAALEYHGSAAEPVPPYVLQFMRRHMERIGSDAQAFLVLARKPWAQAWERLDRGSHAGFLADLTQVRTIAALANRQCAEKTTASTFVAAQLRCALCLSSIASLAADMSAGALLALMAHGVWSPAQAIAYASHISDIQRRLRVLYELAARIERDNRPLALASALTETRQLLAAEGGRNTLHNLLAELLAMSDERLGIEVLACIATSIAAVARQLAEEDRRWLAALLCDLALHCGHPAERAAVLLDAVATQLPPDEARQARERAIHIVTTHLDQPAPAPYVVHRLRLLREVVRSDAVPASSEIVNAALQAAAQCAAILGRTETDDRDALVAAGLACLPLLPADDRGALLALFAPSMTAAHAALAADICTQGVAAAAQASLIAASLRGLSPTARGAAARALIDRVADASLPGAEIFVALNGDPAGSMALAWQWLQHCTTSLAPDEVILLCSRAAQATHSCVPPARLASVALGRIQSLDATGRLDALVGLLDHVVDVGAQDSTEAWRPEPVQQRLARALKRLLRHADEPAAQVLAATRTLADAALPPPARQRLHPLLRDADRLATDSADPAIAEIGERLLAASERSHGSAESFVQAVRDSAEVSGRQTVAEALAWAAPALPRTLAQAAACELLEAWTFDMREADDILALMATLTGPTLFPPGGDLLAVICGAAENASLRNGTEFDDALVRVPLPDMIRHELLLLRLPNAANRLDKKRIAALLGSVGRLAAPSDELLGLALSVCSTAGFDLQAEAMQPVLGQLLQHLPTALLPRWLDLLSDTAPWNRREQLLALQHYRDVDDAAHWQDVAAAIQQLPARRRMAWLTDLAALAGELQIDSTGMLSDASDDLERLQLACAVLPFTRGSDRRQLLHSALVLAQSAPALGALARGLVQFVVDEFAADANLTDEAARAAISLTDAALRSEALAVLAPLLSADTMAWAATAMRRLDDAPQRLRAALTIVAAIADPGRRETVVQRIWTSAQALPEPLVAGAALRLAPWLSTPSRWTALAIGLPRIARAGRRGVGFTIDELLDALCRALPGAPAALCEQAIAWIQQLAPDRHRAQALADLFPSLPRWLQIPTLGLIELSGADDAFFEPLAEHVPDGLLEQAESWLHYLSIPVTRALRRLRAIKERAPAAAESDAGLEVVRASLLQGGELARAAHIRTSCLDATLGQALRYELIEAGTALRDPDLRARTACYLAVLADAASAGSAERAIARIESPADRAMAAAVLARHLPAAAQERLLEQARRWIDEEAEPQLRLATVAEIAAIAPQQLSTWLALMLPSQERTLRIALLQRLITQQRGDPQALTTAFLGRLGEERERCAILLRTIAVLDGAATAAALEVAHGLASAVDRARLLVPLVARLAPDAADDAQKLLDTVSTDFAWLEALASMGQRWPNVLTAARLTRVRKCLPGIADDEFIVGWVRQVAPVWPTPELAVLAEAASRMREPIWVCEALNALAPVCPATQLPMLIEIAHGIADPFYRGVALGHLAQRTMPPDPALLEAALDAAANSGARQRGIDALVAMTISAGTTAPAALERLLDQYRQHPLRILGALNAIAPWLRPEQTAAVLTHISRHGHHDHDEACAELLSALYAQLAATERNTLVDTLTTVCSARVACQTLQRLAPEFDPATAAIAFDAAMRIAASATERRQTSVSLLVSLDDEHQIAVLRMLARTSRERELAEWLSQAVPDLRPAARSCAIEMAQHFETASRRDALLLQLGDTKAAEPAVMSAGASGHAGPSRMDPDASLRSLLDDALAPWPQPQRTSEFAAGTQAKHALPAELRLSRLLTRLRHTEAEADRHDIIRATIPQLPEPQLERVAWELPAFLSGSRLADALSAIWATWRQTRPDNLFAALRALDNASMTRNVLRRIPAATVADPAWLEAFNGYIDDVSRDAGRLGRTDCLAWLTTLAPIIATLGGDEALAEVVDAIDDAGTLWP